MSEKNTRNKNDNERIVNLEVADDDYQNYPFALSSVAESHFLKSSQVIK